MTSYSWPSSGGGSNASVGSNGSAAPANSTEIGTVDISGNLQPISSTNPLPVTGTVVESNDSIGATGVAVPTSATQMGANKGGLLVAPFMGQQTMANSLAIVIASDQGGIPVTGTFFQTTQPISAVSLPLPANAAQENGGNLAIIATAQGTPGTGISEPAGGAGLLGWLSGIYKALIGTLTISGTVSVSSSSAESGHVPVTFVRNVYSTTPVTTGAYVQLIASTPAVINYLYIFDSSGQTLEIAFGASGSEIPQFLVVPGGNGPVPVLIPLGTRVSIRDISATASVGEIDINALQ